MYGALLEPTTKEIDGVRYILSKFPAVAGREIVSGYPLSALPKVGDYKSNETIMLKLMSFVAVVLSNGNEQRLSTQDLINNHVPSWETLAKIEMEMLTYNCSFFQNGRISNFLKDSAQKLPEWITKILTDLLAQLSPANKPPSTN